MSESIEFYSNRFIMGYVTFVRLLTCVAIVILGKAILCKRSQNEKELKRRNNIHGTEAESLDILKILKRGIKDVIKLNFWTCIFVVPMGLASLLITIGREEEIIIISLFFTSAVYLVSNPIIYLLCFTKIRQFWWRSGRIES